MKKSPFESYLAAPWKAEYVRKKKDSNECILCAIANKNKSITAWEVFRDDQAMILLNKYPYNPGHLLIVPLDHFEEFDMLSASLSSHLTILIQSSIKLLKKTHFPLGFNIGLNIGNVSGASVRHIHWHIVPRYYGDYNFLEILGTRVMVETLPQTLIKLQKEIEILRKNTF
ncbi:HIT family protein [Candidatus Hodarchaeum mangrovi]